MRVVLTGGPHAGKTTLLKALEARGIRTVHEAALEEIRSLAASLGPENVQAWRRAHISEFQLRVSKRQKANEAAIQVPPTDLLIFDRGTIDGIAYCAHHNIPVPPELLEIARSSHYDLAVLCDLILPFDSRPESGRTSDEAIAKNLDALLEKTYKELNVPTLRLPAMPPAARELMLLQLIQAQAFRLGRSLQV